MMLGKVLYLFLLSLFLLSGSLVWGDKGSVSPSPVKLSEDSQRAIIMHNFKEEVLILGTELKADKETDVLEFIPFPSEPTVKSASGDPFKEIERLMRENKVIWLDRNISKGGGGGTVPIEIKFSEKIGLHYITVIKINDISAFTKWVERFFSKKGIKVTNDLSSFYKNAEDYAARGINYFVFDYVSLKREKRSIEPLIYRFKTDKIYYPLKTSNVVGGKGVVDLIFISPGSFAGEKTMFPFNSSTNFYSPTIKIGDSPFTYFELSNSAMISPEKIKTIYPEANEFFSKTKKLYIQVMRYAGQYNFKDDFFFDTLKLDPQTYAWDTMRGSYPWESYYYLRPVDDVNIKKGPSKEGEIEHRAYHILMADETVTFRNGKYERNLPENYLLAAIDRAALGDLNKDGINDAAVILYSSGGGSGAFYELTVLLGSGESFEQVDSISLGDRVKINALAVKNGIVTLNMLSHKRTDPSCCPSEKVIKQFRIVGKKLVEVKK